AESICGETSTHRPAAPVPQLEEIIATALDAIVSVDEQQRVVLFNPAAEKMFGIPAKEMFGESIERLIPGRFPLVPAGQAAGLGHTGPPLPNSASSIPIKGLRANGQEFLIEASISQVVAGEQKFFNAILRDVSSRARTDRREESDARKAAILDCALDCIISIDHEGRITEVNAAAERVFGFRSDEMVGKEMAELIIP